MNNAPTIADTGVIVGLIYEKDQWHEFAMKQAENLPVPYFTCEAVITEACFLLQGVRDGERKVLQLVEKGILQIDFSLSNEVVAIRTLMQKYENVPMSFADACLVRMSELIENSVVFTVDGDFRIYRKHGKKQIPLIIPDSV
ncbi:hypothetical protein BH20ACI1_BH20ACI1_06480 [soil metagenome]